MNRAVIDLGSNTIRLIVYRCEGRKFTTMFRQKEIAGLAGYVENKRLKVDGIDKACVILRGFREIAVRFVDERDIHMFATAALRGIINQNQVLETIRSACGVLPEVLSGEEEARLDFIGASYFTECRDGVLIDIGGASTELVRFQSGQPTELASLPIGCLSLYTEFVGKIIPTEKERKKIKKAIRAQFDQNIGWLSAKPTAKSLLMIGVGGTVRAAHKLSCGLFALPEEQKNVKRVCVHEILKMLKANEHKIYHTLYKLVPERILTIFTGLLILNGAMKRLNCDSFFVSGCGVREGYLIDRVLANVGCPPLEF